MGCRRRLLGGGLASFDGQRWQASGPPRERDDAPVSDVETTPDGDVWAVMEDAEATPPRPVAARFDGRRWVSYGGAEGMSGAVQDLAIGPDGTVWAGTDTGLARFVAGRGAFCTKASP